MRKQIGVFFLPDKMITTNKNVYYLQTNTFHADIELSIELGSLKI